MGEVEAIAIARVDAGGFESIARREADRLYGLALAILRDPAEAEDAVQDALLAAWRFWPNLHDPTRVQPWLTRICVNSALRRRRWLGRLTLHDLDGVPAPAISRDERLLGFDRAFARLSLKQRAVFALHVHYGLTVEECARAWMPAGMTQGWVESDPVKDGGAPIDFRFYDEAHQRSIRISVVVPGNSNLAAANRRLSFRGAEAYYQYFTGPPPLPLSLAWTEPGHWSGGAEQLKIPGVPYVLATYGLSEADFWRVANSLQAS